MIEVRENDLQPVAETVIRRGSNIVDLTAEGATAILFRMRHRYESVIKVEAAGTIFDGPNGILRYAWVAADTTLPALTWRIGWSPSLEVLRLSPPGDRISSSSTRGSSCRDHPR